MNLCLAFDTFLENKTGGWLDTKNETDAGRCRMEQSGERIQQMKSTDNFLIISYLCVCSPNIEMLKIVLVRFSSGPLSRSRPTLPTSPFI